MRKLMYCVILYSSIILYNLSVYSDRPFSIFQKVPETRRKFPSDWEYHNIDQMNAPDLYQGMLIHKVFLLLSHNRVKIATDSTV